MRITLIAVLSMLLMLFAFASCNNSTPSPSKEDVAAVKEQLDV